MLWFLKGSSTRVIRKWEYGFYQSCITALLGHYVLSVFDGPGQRLLQMIGTLMSIIGGIGLIFYLGRGMLALVFRRLGGITHVTVYDEFFDKREGSESSVQVQRLKRVEEEND